MTRQTDCINFHQGGSMEWKNSSCGRIPILSWSTDIEKTAMDQAVNLSRHSRTFHHVAIMPDCHPGYGMPIGGVIACIDTVIPYAVGVDIGCGMCAARSDVECGNIVRAQLDRIVETAGRRIPVGEGHSHGKPQKWDQFERIPEWLDDRGKNLAFRSLGSLGGGNHFLEIQEGDDGWIWLMVHSGSRNPGYRIAKHHHGNAVRYCRNHSEELPTEDLSWLPADSASGMDYLRDMEFALDYAAENRRRLMESFKRIFAEVTGKGDFSQEINIHHNYAACEKHFDKSVWIHRKGATSARKGQMGIIPGSMGTHSYIVEGLGNPDSFTSCSHGAGRVMSRREASRKLSLSECDSMMQGIVFSGWKKYRGYGRRKAGSPSYDLSEAPAAYKDIDEVIGMQLDLIKPLVKLKPLGVIKG